VAATRKLLLLISTLTLVAGFVGIVHGQDERHVLLLEINGAINSVTEGYLTRGVERAKADGAYLLVAALDTSGGDFDSTRRMVGALLNAKVPTVVYVTPLGARAASAGTFVAAAADFAVMAPGTNIGAATPIAADGTELPGTVMVKATNDAAALMRSIATRRGRNVERLEETVREATSYTAEEAVVLGLVDFIAVDLEDLLSQLDGASVILPAGEKILDTDGLDLRSVNMNLAERFLMLLSNPNVSFLLLSLGCFGIFIELLSPGLVAPGVIGAVFLVLAFVSMGNVPLDWLGVVLILLAVPLGVAEFYLVGLGVLGIGAIVSFTVGALLLYFQVGPPSPTMARTSISLWVLAPIVLAVIAGGTWIITTILKSRSEVLQSTSTMRDTSVLSGSVGIVRYDLAPVGTVLVASEIWQARSEDGIIIRAGTRVSVMAMDGLTLIVKRV
jgi:membrane-bound serine protease (ClpP class)